MNNHNVDRLSDSQKNALRLVLAGHEAKEIARKLEISPHAVVERLRAARRTLGVGSSREAARLLALHEQPEAYNRLVDRPLGIAVEKASGSDHVLSTESGGPAEIGPGGVFLREDQAPYLVKSFITGPRFPWPVRMAGRERNDLSVLQTLIVVVVLTLGLASAALVSIAIVELLSRLHPH